MEAPAAPKLDVDAHFNALVASLQQEQPEPEDNDRITVLLDLPYLAKYGRDPRVELVYGCSFPVAVGDKVLCPPTPRGDGSWWAGTVTALNGGDYRGPVKYVRKIGSTDA